MATVTLETAQATLSELLDRLLPGEEITITKEGVPVAQFKKTEHIPILRQPGTAKDRFFWMAPDFNAPLDEFGEEAG